MSELEPVSPAFVPPWAAYVLVRDFPAVVAGLQTKGEALVIAGNEAAGRQLLTAVTFLRKAHREQAAAANRVSAFGSAEVPSRGSASQSDRPPPGFGLTPREVVERFEVAGLKISDRQVRNLCKPGGGLSATKPGGGWLVDEVSVALEIERRQAEL